MESMENGELSVSYRWKRHNINDVEHHGENHLIMDDWVVLFERKKLKFFENIAVG